MKLKNPWKDFLFLVCMIGFGVIGIQEASPAWRWLAWTVALSGAFGLLLFVHWEGNNTGSMSDSESPSKKEGKVND